MAFVACKRVILIVDYAGDTAVEFGVGHNAERIIEAPKTGLKLQGAAPITVEAGDATGWTIIALACAVKLRVFPRFAFRACD